MPKLRGNDLIVFFEQGGEWKTLAYATTCEIDIQAETIEIGSPDTGRWVKKKKRRISWSVNSGHLMSNVKQKINLYNYLLSDNPVKISVASVENHTERIYPEDYTPDGRYSLIGEALVTRMTITGNRGDFCTLSMSLAGIGELLQKSADWILADGAWNMEGVWIDWEKWNF